MLFGPGVMDDAKAKRARAATFSNMARSICKLAPIIAQAIQNYLAKFVQTLHLLQDMTKIDEFDSKILRILEKEGRISNSDLAVKVGLSASACLRRVQALEAHGVIKGYRAVLDRKQLGLGFTVFVTVGLARHLKSDQEAFERAMQTASQVRECHNVSGTIEYLLRVEVADLEAYKYFHTEVLGIVPQVNSIVSHFVMGSAKDERA